MFLIAQNVIMPDKGDSVLGHAVDAAKVAAICYGDSQIVYVAVVRVNELYHGEK